MDVVSRPGGENIYQVGGSRGGVVAGFALHRDAADDGKRAKTRRVARWTLVSSPGQGEIYRVGEVQEGERLGVGSW